MNEETSVFNGGISELWAAIAAKQGDTFYTAKNLPFTYKVKGGELFTDRRERAITKSTFERAYEKILADPSIQGPKKLNVYGGAVRLGGPQKDRSGACPRARRGAGLKRTLLKKDVGKEKGECRQKNRKTARSFRATRNFI